MDFSCHPTNYRPTIRQRECTPEHDNDNLTMTFILDDCLEIHFTNPHYILVKLSLRVFLTNSLLQLTILFEIPPPRPLTGSN